MLTKSQSEIIAKLKNEFTQINKRTYESNELIARIQKAMDDKNSATQKKIKDSEIYNVIFQEKVNKIMPTIIEVCKHFNFEYEDSGFGVSKYDPFSRVFEIFLNGGNLYIHFTVNIDSYTIKNDYLICDEKCFIKFERENYLLNCESSTSQFINRLGEYIIRKVN